MTDDLTLMPKKTVMAETTKIVLNGVDKSGGVASFYAPFISGTANQLLVSNGDSNAPTWNSSITTSAIVSTTNVGMCRDKNTDRLTFYGGTDLTNGAYLRLGGKDYSTQPGGFFIFLNSGTKSCEMRGDPDGTLTWGGKRILTENDIQISGKYYFTIAGLTFTFIKYGRIVNWYANGSLEATTAETSLDLGHVAWKPYINVVFPVFNDYMQSYSGRYFTLNSGVTTLKLQAGSAKSNVRGYGSYIAFNTSQPG